MLHLKEPRYISDEELLQTYNELYEVYKGQPKELLLLGIAFKNALNGEYTHLYDFDNYVEGNSRSLNLFSPVISEVQEKTLYISRFGTKQNILDDIQDNDSIESKTILINTFLLNFGFSIAGDFRNKNMIKYLSKVIVSFLGYEDFLFKGEFPNISILLNNLIPNGKVAFSEGLDYLISIFFILGSSDEPGEVVSRLKNFDDFVGKYIDFREYFNKKISGITNSLVSVGIYLDGKIFQKGDKLTKEESELLNNRLSKKFGTTLKYDFENISLDETKLIIEGLIFNEVSKLLSGFDKNFGDYLLRNIGIQNNKVFRWKVYEKVKEFGEYYGIFSFPEFSSMISDGFWSMILLYLEESLVNKKMIEKGFAI